MAKHSSTYMTTDIVVVRNSRTEVLLIQRKHDPFKGAWAVPGGFFDRTDQNLLAGAARELLEETNLDLSLTEFKPVGTYSDRGRDPREDNPDDPCRIVSQAFVVELKGDHPEIEAKDDAAALKFFPLAALPALAFDHALIIADALARLNSD